MKLDKRNQLTEDLKHWNNEALVREVVEMYKLLGDVLIIMGEYGDFSNGNIHNGLDEGEVLTRRFIDSMWNRLPISREDID